MRRAVSAILSGTLALSLFICGCAGSQAGAPESDEATESQKSVVEGDGTVVGAEGWQVNAEATPLLSEEDQSVFAKAAAGFDGPSFDPVAVLASQVVSGKNVAFLCKGADQGGWFVVVVYQNPDGESFITSAQELKVDDLRVAVGAPIGALLGSWQVQDQVDVTLLPKAAGDAFASAKGGYADAMLDPIATLATRTDSGTEYLVLCEGEAKEADAPRSLFVVVVHADSGSDAQLTDVAQLEFLSCVSASA